MGPILFLIYINDLLRLNLEKYNGTIYAYADDTAILFKGKTWQETYDNSNIGLSTIKHWFDSNLLSLNTSKTTVVPFSLTTVSMKSDSNLNIKIHIHDCKELSCNCPIVKESSEVKYLGIIIDQHLKWDKHVTYLCNRLRKLIHFFVILRSCLSLDSLRLIYLSLIQSVLQYGILGWGSAFSSALTPLIILQKKIIKICLKKPIEYPSELLFSDFKVFQIHQLYYYVLLCYIQKNYVKFPKHTHNYETKRSNFINLLETKCFTTKGLNHSNNFGPRLYNRTMDKYPHLQNYTIPKFKKSIKYVIHNEYK